MVKYVKNARPGNRYARYHLSPKRLLVILIVVVIAVFALLELTNTTHLFHKQKPVAQAGSANTKGLQNTSTSDSSDSSDSSDTTSQAPTTQPGDVKHQGTAPDQGASLIAPWGEFANQYQVSAGTKTQMVSTCNTTPGASCQLIFTKGSTTKSLSAQTTDRGGATRWAWLPSQPGLTPGTWHIMFKAVLGSQSKTTSNDPLTLEVSQ